MFASSTLLTTDPARLDDVIRAFDQGVQQGLRGEPGFQHAYLLTDKAAGRVLVVVLWDAEATAKNFEATGKLRQHFGDFLRAANDPNFQRSVYEVSVNQGP